MSDYELLNSLKSCLHGVEIKIDRMLDMKQLERVSVEKISGYYNFFIDLMFNNLGFGEALEAEYKYHVKINNFIRPVNRDDLSPSSGFTRDLLKYPRHKILLDTFLGRGLSLPILMTCIHANAASGKKFVIVNTSELDKELAILVGNKDADALVLTSLLKAIQQWNREVDVYRKYL
jgi:hypothetical protein